MKGKLQQLLPQRLLWRVSFHGNFVCDEQILGDFCCERVGGKMLDDESIRIISRMQDVTEVPMELIEGRLV